MRRIAALFLLFFFIAESCLGASAFIGGRPRTVFSYSGEGALTPEKRQNSAIPTFDRNSAQTFTDWENNLVRASDNDEAVFTGARRVENLLADDSSEDFSVASWTKEGTATVTGTNTLNFPAEGDGVRQNLATTLFENKKFIFSVSLSGTGTCRIYTMASLGGSTIKQVTLTATPTRYTSGVYTALSTDPNRILQVQIFRIVGDTATTVTATNAQLEEVTAQTNQNPGEYVSTHTAYDGQSVKGVRYFNYENGNTVDGNGVVTEAQGAALSTLKGFSYEPATTNKIAGAYNAVGPDMLSAELTTNGDASNTTSTDSSVAAFTGWTNEGTHNAANKFTISGGAFNFTTDGSAGFFGIRQGVLTVGRRYQYSVNITAVAGNGIRLRDTGGVTHGTYTTTGVKTGTFTATGTGIGMYIPAAAGVCSATFDDFSIKEIGAANTSGVFVSGLGTSAAATRVATATWNNPLPGITCSGGTDGESSLTIVSDTAKLASATPKLTRLIPSGKVYKAVAGASASMDIALTGNLSAATHTVSLYARGASAADDAIALGDATTGVGAPISLTDEYQLISYTYTAAAAATKYTIPAGDTVYFVLMQSEALTVPSARVRVEGAAASRLADSLTIPIADGTNWSQPAFTLQTTATFDFASTSIPNSGSLAIWSTADSATSVLYIDRTAGGQLQMNSTDGTNTVTTNLSEWTAGDSITFKVTGHKNRNKLNHYSSTDGWGTAGSYDGVVTLGTNHRIGYSSAYPFSLKDTTVTNTFDKAGL